jgi:hypothetical protein
MARQNGCMVTPAVAQADFRVTRWYLCIDYFKEQHVTGIRALFVLSLAAAGFLVATGCDESIRSSKTAAVGLTPQTGFTFSKITFGSQDFRRVQVLNSGNGDLLISKISIGQIAGVDEFQLRIGDSPEADAADNVGYEFGGGDNFSYPMRIAPSESLYFFLDYKPASEDSPGGDRGAVRLETNLRDAEVLLPVRVSQSGAEINVTPSTLNFDRVAAGDTKTEDLTVTNIGQADLVISSVLLNGSQDFTPLINGKDPRRQPEVLEDPDGDGTPGLSPDASFVLSVRYAPQIEGPDQAELSIFSNDARIAETRIPIVANGETPCLRTNPPALEFPTSLVNRTDSRPLAIESCGGQEVEIVSIRLADGSDPAFELDEESLPDLPTILPAAVNGAAPDPRFVRVSFTPREQRIYNGTLLIESTDPVNPIREVSLLGRGVLNACPQARAAQDEFNVVPLDVVTLDGGPSIDQDGPDNRPVEYQWVVVDRPERSVSQPVEDFFRNDAPADGGRQDDLATATSKFFVDLAGTYVLELRVRDNLGLDSIACDNPARVVIVAKPDQAIHVQLVWRTPEDPDETDTTGTDLDLHLLHPNAQNWFTSPYDCHYANPAPDWNALEDPRDDPSLDIDDINGSGPENINLDEPEDTDLLGAPYLIGVHYYQSADRVTQEDFGSSFAKVRVFLNGELAWDFSGDEEAGDREMEAADHFWDVAQISWNAQTRQGEVTTRDRYYTQRP